MWSGAVDAWLVAGKGDGCAFTVKVVQSGHMGDEGDVVIDNEHIEIECD